MKEPAPLSALPALWKRATQAGVRPVGEEAWNVLRVEAGRVRHGVDVDGTTLLLEAPLDDAYSLGKGCYIGQEVVARVTYRGHVNRKVVGFAFPDARLPAAGAAVTVEGRGVGRITSAVVSPALGRGLALGFLRREHWAPGTRVEVDSRRARSPPRWRSYPSTGAPLRPADGDGFGTGDRQRACGQPAGPGDEPLPSPAPVQSRRLVPLGRGGVRPGPGRGQADPPLRGLLRLPLVPRD